MTEYEVVQNPKRCPTHPGILLAEIIENSGLSKVKIATMLGISRQHLHNVINGSKPVSPDTAVRLGKLYGNGSAIWLSMQSAHDAWCAEQNIDLSKIPTLELPQDRA